jgi:spore germination cell wall hydrolase CwlJ-like protein
MGNATTAVWASSRGLMITAMCMTALVIEGGSIWHKSVGDWNSQWSEGTLTIGNRDIDVMVRTVIGEAANESEEGKAAVAHVIMNRARMNVPHYGGSNVADVALHNASIMRPTGKRRVWQFEPWMHTKIKTYLWAIPVTSERYQHVKRIVLGCVNGDIADPTNGATHFLNPDIVRSRTGGSLPGWAQGTGKRIGTHVFFKSRKSDEAL